MLLSVLLVLTVIAAGSRLPFAALLFGNPEGGETVERGAETAACSSAGTMFDPEADPAMRRPSAVVSRYRELAAGIVEEREEHLRAPSSWSCDAESFEELAPDSPRLRDLAENLPSWDDDEPVVFSSFTPLLLELQRVYECTLSEFERDVDGVVNRGHDSLYDDEEQSLPETFFTTTDRVDRLQREIQKEKRITRAAVERSVEVFRSFELASPFAVELHCLHREATDVRNNLSLIADAVSCMPRIWDISTSLHDRAGE